MTSRISSDAPDRQVITVQIVDQQVTLKPQEVTLQHGQIAIWQIEGLGDGQSCSIRFDDAERQGLGPFACLHSGHAVVRGQGDGGRSGPFPYQAAILDAEGETVASAIGTVHNQRSRDDSAPVIEVTVDASGGVCSIKPFLTRLYPNGVVTFQFHGLDQSMVPRVRFTHFDPLSGTDSEPAGALGPFNALDHGPDHIIGHGFDERFGSFHYVIDVVDLGGRRITLQSSRDPVLDRLPEPIDTTPYEPPA